MTARRPPHPGVMEVPIERQDGRVERDWVAVEEPLEIRVDGQPLAVTMRTPGADRELAAGFLFTEGVIDGREDLEAIEPCANPDHPDAQNLILVGLKGEARGDGARLRRAQREFRAVAACGLCGKARLEDVWQKIPPIEPLECAVDFLRQLPDRMKEGQELFRVTGGIHAAALFDPQGKLLGVREDVGRHNAVDKLIGRFLLDGNLPLAGRILVVSGRAGFEIVQKAMMAAIPVLVAVGAASSLAVEMAREGGLALYSFVSQERGNRHVEGAHSERP